MTTHVQEEDLTEAEKRFRRERGGGNYGLGTKEVQEKRYIERREAERKRRELFNDALAMYKSGDLENVRQGHAETPAAILTIARLVITAYSCPEKLFAPSILRHGKRLHVL